MADQEIKLILTTDSAGAVSGIDLVTDATSKMESDTGGLLSQVKEHWMGFSAAVLAAYETLQKSFEYINLGAKASQAEQSFNAVAKSFNVDSEQLVASMKKASAGTVADADIMQKAIKGLIAGLQPEQMTHIMEAARVAARVEGESIKEEYEKIMQAIATNQPKSLKSTGLLDKEDITLFNQALSAGITNIKLYDLVMAHATIQAGAFGQMHTNAAERLQQFSASWQNFKENVGMGLLNLIDGIKGFANSLVYFIEGAFAKLVAGILGATLKIQQGLKSLLGEDFPKKFGLQWDDSIAQSYQKTNAYAKQMFDLAKSGGQKESPISNIGGSPEDVAAAQQRLKDLRQHLKDLIAETKNKGAVDEFSIQLLEWQKRIEALNPSLDKTEVELLKLYDDAEKLKARAAQKGMGQDSIDQINAGLLKGSQGIQQRDEDKQRQEWNNFWEVIEADHGTALQKDLAMTDRWVVQEAQKYQGNYGHVLQIVQEGESRKRAIIDKNNEAERSNYLTSMAGLVTEYDKLGDGARKWGESELQYTQRVMAERQKMIPLLEQAKAQLQQEGLIGTDAYTRIKQALDKYEDDLKATNATFKEGFTQGLQAYSDKLKDTFTQGSQAAQTMINGMTSAFQNFFNFNSKSFLDFKQLGISILETIWQELVKIAVEAAIIKPLMGVLGFHEGGLVMHSGGLVMHEGGYIPRFHTGGLSSDEVPAILQRGEYVVSRKGVETLDAINSGNVGSQNTSIGNASTQVQRSFNVHHINLNGVKPNDLVRTGDLTDHLAKILRPYGIRLRYK